jgi:hypothetical protein
MESFALFFSRMERNSSTLSALGNLGHSSHSGATGKIRRKTKYFIDLGERNTYIKNSELFLTKVHKVYPLQGGLMRVGM